MIIGKKQNKHPVTLKKVLGSFAAWLALLFLLTPTSVSAASQTLYYKCASSGSPSLNQVASGTGVKLYCQSIANINSSSGASQYAPTKATKSADAYTVTAKCNATVTVKTASDAVTFTCSNKSKVALAIVQPAASGANSNNAQCGDPAHGYTCVNDPANQNASDGNSNLFKQYINPAINFLSVSIGIIVAISIVIGGIQYSASAGDPGKAQKARDRIRNSIVALIVYIFLWAAAQWLIPGGFGN